MALIEAENIAKVFKAVFDNAAGKAVLEHLRTLFDVPVNVENPYREYWNAGRRAALQEIIRLVNQH
jgi:hypothetical protein